MTSCIEESLSLDYLNLLINGQAFSDVTFSLEGRLVHAHRCILAARSLFFRKFFYGSDPPQTVTSSASGARVASVGGVVPVNSKHLTSMVEKASIEDVMKVLIASRKQDMHQLWTTCSYLVAKSGFPTEILAKHLPIELLGKVEELRLKSSIPLRSLMPHQQDQNSALNLEDQKIKRMRRALDSSDFELVKLMVMGEGLNLDESLALFYAVENCSREVVKALLELGAADVNHPAGPTRKTALHIAAEMVSPDMVAVLLDHHADPTVQTVDGITPLDILRTLTSDFLFKGTIHGLTHIEPNKLRLCLELVQSAAMVISREEGNNNNNVNNTVIYPRMKDKRTKGSSLDSRLVYLNRGATNPDFGDEHGIQTEETGLHHHHYHDPSTMYHHHHHHHF
ncbi:regulatory protein NPR6-like isoform X2 [Brassica napus]|uniref:regulatory protein NPR6-like isoform X2 n=1 Tax=Brassica napus TaxID=3708 RepID=UPI002078A0BC|nr:regulatory protein NPR6-like isoform X2 [Brassica napus]